MSASSPEYLIQQPQQNRSRATMEQILDAAAEILEIKNFETLTISEVVEKAGTSVGAFYGRFRDKEALLHALDARFFADFEQGFFQLLAPSRWQGKSAAYIIQDACRFLFAVYNRQKGVLRSLNLKARLENDPAFRKREQRAWDELFPLLQAALLACKDEIRHPNPPLAIRLGFQQMFFSMREILLWEPLRGSAPYDSEVLIKELSRAFFAYLRLASEENANGE